MTHAIAGARAHITDPEATLRHVRAWAVERGAEVCLADARVIFGADHMESAAVHAERSRDTATMATRSLAMETLLYLAGERQVADAIRVAGLKSGTGTVGIVLFGDASVDALFATLGWDRDDSALDAKGKPLSALGISKRARATLSEGRGAELALEKVALIDVEK